MRKILSCILAAAMLAGMLAVCVVAENDTNTMLKFNDIPKNTNAGTVGMANIFDTDTISNGDFTMSMDFIYGRSGPCYHPVDATMKHTSKFAFMVGESEGTYKYLGYSATEDFFFLGTCANSPVYGEGADGIEYLATSETGLVNPGQLYRIDFEFTGDTGIRILLDGEEILTFDLYDDLEYPTYFAFSGLMIYPTHITCFIDNVEIKVNGADTPFLSSTFEDAEMVTNEEGAVIASVPGWQIMNDTYSLVDASFDVYAQAQYPVAENQANIIFQSGLDKKANGAEEIFASGTDFNIKVTMSNNAGFDSVVLDLVSDPYITVKSVKAADGLTASLGETDANGVTKLTLTGDNYTGEALATVTYTMDASATQDHLYRYGAVTDTVKVEGAVSDVVLTNGESKLYNYTVGDLNDDGKFNLIDVGFILKFCAKWDLPGMFKEAGEVNGDGRVNSMDASYYLKWLARWPYDYTINGITWYK